MDVNRSFAVPDHILSCDVAGETVLLDKAGGRYFGLDAIGSRMWTLMRAGHSLRTIRDTLLEEYDVSAGDLERDLLRLATDLTARRLLEPLS